MRRALGVALSLMLVLGLATGCAANSGDGSSGTAGEKTEPASSGSSPETQASGEVTVETFEAWLAEQPDTDAWYSKATSTEMTTRLRKPTILVFVDMPSSELQGYANDVGNEWINGEDGQTTGLRIVSNDGFVFQGGAPLWMEFADSVPESPASADEIMTWLGEAYGEASGDPVDEAWYSAIKGGGLNAERQAVELETDLTYGDPAAIELVNVIGDVLTMAHPADVSGWIVRYADGTNEHSSIYDQ